MNRAYRIFTDGSAIGNPGPGGLGAVLMQGSRRWEMSGSSPWVTISEMELVAAVQSLRSLSDRAWGEFYSDSEYLVYGMRAFVFRWEHHGWRNRRGSALQFRKLWEELIGLDAWLRIRWTWIKGHSGHRDQSRADALANQAARLYGCKSGRRLKAGEGHNIVLKRRSCDGFDCGNKLAL